MTETANPPKRDRLRLYNVIMGLLHLAQGVVVLLLANDFTLAEIKTLGAKQTRGGRPTEFDGKFKVPTLQEVINLVKRESRKHGRKVGICGQAPSDYPEYAEFLVQCGINSISFNADALLKGIENIHSAEKKK